MMNRSFDQIQFHFHGQFPDVRHFAITVFEQANFLSQHGRNQGNVQSVGNDALGPIDALDHIQRDLISGRAVPIYSVKMHQIGFASCSF